MTRPVDLSGQPFGAWTVQDLYEVVQGNRYWYCVCQCGEERFVRASALMKGTSLSCGCGSHAPRKRGAGVKVQYRMKSPGNRWRLLAVCSPARAAQWMKQTAGKIEYRVVAMDDATAK